MQKKKKSPSKALSGHKGNTNLKVETKTHLKRLRLEAHRFPQNCNHFPPMLVIEEQGKIIKGILGRKQMQVKDSDSSVTAHWVSLTVVLHQLTWHYQAVPSQCPATISKLSQYMRQKEAGPTQQAVLPQYISGYQNQTQNQRPASQALQSVQPRYQSSFFHQVTPMWAVSTLSKQET